MIQQTLVLVYIAFITFLLLSNFQAFAMEQASEINLVKGLTQNIKGSYNVRLEILAPKDESIIYVKENRYIEPFEFKIRITNLGNDTFNLNSNLKVSLERSPIEGPMQVRIWNNDDLKLEPNEFFEESGTEFHHIGFSKYSKPSFGEQKLNLHLVEYIEANQSYVRTETTSILLNFVSEQPTELTIIIGVIVAGEIGVISYWALKKIISKKRGKKATKKEELRVRLR